MVQQLKRRLKLTTDKQTGQKQIEYASDLSTRGHKNFAILIILFYIGMQEYKDKRILDKACL